MFGANIPVSVLSSGAMTAVGDVLYVMGTVNSTNVLLSVALPSDPCQAIRNDRKTCLNTVGCSACNTANNTYCYSSRAPIPTRLDSTFLLAEYFSW